MKKREGWLARIVATCRDAYGGLPRAAWILALLELTNRSGMMVLFFLTLYVTRELGGTLADAGFVMSAYGVGSMVGTYWGGRLCDRIGAYHVQKLSLASSGVLLIALQFPRHPAALASLMAVLAAAQEALHPANATATAQLCTPELRPKGFALHRLAGNLGVSVGPLIGGYLALVGYRWLFWVDGLTSLLAAALAWVLLPHAGPHGEGPVPRPSGGPPAWRNRRFVVLLPLVWGIGIVFTQIFTTFPLYLRLAYGFREDGIGLLLAINTTLIVLTEMLLMHGLRRRQPARVVAVGTLLLGLGFGLMPFGRGGLYAALTVVIWSLGEILTLPMLMTLVSSRSDPEAQGEYQGLVSLAFATAFATGPALGTWAYARTGGAGVFYVDAAIGLVLSIGFFCLRPLGPSRAVQ